MNKFWYTRESSNWFLETVDDISFSLKEQWFWIISTIDVQSKVGEKLWKYIDEYYVLWACNPGFAVEALELEYEIWLFFPCNVIVYKKDNKIFVSTILPSLVMNMIENEKLYKFAKVIEEKLIKAVDNM
jgi:uncharacterized protein (DUF302 family)